MRTALRWVAGTAAALALTSVAVADRGDQPRERSDERTTYAVFGDTPYGAPQAANFANDVAEINADRSVKLVMHLGDIKSGSTTCDDAYFGQIRAAFDAFRTPLVYTPGDNEWTDCHRVNNGAYNPLERLATIRRVFFPKPGRTLGRPMKVTAQAAPTIENVRWEKDDVVFATTHVVGSNNGWLPWTGRTAPTPEQAAEYQARNAANLAWLKSTFALARHERAKAVVIGIQADMWDTAFSGPNNQPLAYDRFTDYVQELARQSAAFGRPVLLLDGDSHVYTDDRPLADPAKPHQKTMYGLTADVPNLRRITVNGSTTACHEWLKLSVSPRTPGVFGIERVRFRNQPGFDPAVCPAS